MDEKQMEAEQRKMLAEKHDDELRAIMVGEDQRLLRRQVALQIMVERENERRTAHGMPRLTDDSMMQKLSDREVAMAGGRSGIEKAMLELKQKAAPKVLVHEVRASAFLDPALSTQPEHLPTIPGHMTLPATDASPDATDEQIWRANYAGLSVDQLGDIVLDDNSTDTQREVALALISEKQTQAAIEARKAAVDDTPADPVSLPAEASTNRAAADRFARALSAVGLTTGVRATNVVQGRPVKDGWAVNVRDEDREIGYVAAWWGRAHFLAYIEMAGHRSRTDEAAQLFADFHRMVQERAEERGE